MSKIEDVYFQEKKNIDELEKRLASIKIRIKELEKRQGSIKIRNYILLALIILFFGMWSIILSGSGSSDELIHWGSILGLAFGTLVGIGLLLMLIRSILSFVTVEPDA